VAEDSPFVFQLHHQEGIGFPTLEHPERTLQARAVEAFRALASVEDELGEAEVVELA
jgi:hypothetical protein